MCHNIHSQFWLLWNGTIKIATRAKTEVPKQDEKVCRAKTPGNPNELGDHFQLF